MENNILLKWHKSPQAVPQKQVDFFKKMTSMLETKDLLNKCLTTLPDAFMATAVLA